MTLPTAVGHPGARISQAAGRTVRFGALQDRSDAAALERARLPAIEGDHDRNVAIPHDSANIEAAK